MRGRAEPTVSEGPSGHRGRWYVLALVAALVLGLVAAVPVFAADQENGEPKVVGGKPVPDGKYRFVASLEARFPEEPGGGPSGPFFQYCGGSLVDRTHVLTAAHCAEFIGGGPGGLPLEDFRVVVGRTVLGGDRGQVRRVDGLRDISIHPRWGPASSNAYDVAVIGLDRPVVGIGPIKPATARQDFLERPGRLATVIGWGNTTSVPPFGGGEVDFPRRLREAEVPVVSDAEAREAYGRVYNPRTMVAAGKKGKDACFGDSGGPLFDTVAGKRYQVGIVSFGYGCARIRFPGVYTEVNAARVRGFIERKTARN